jgi:XRE family transcriptional regulator, regulator of sulfur utilization
MKHIPVELRALRTAHRKTLAQLAEQTGLSLSFLSDVERGRTDPSLETLRKIAAAYGMELRVEFVWTAENDESEAY